MDKDRVKCKTCKGSSTKGACPHCRKRLIKILKELIQYIDFLNANPSLRQQVLTQQETRGSLSHSLIINVQIVDLLSKKGIQLMLEDWANFICDVRSLNKTILNKTNKHSKLHQIQFFLINHNDWIADSDQWKDYYEEIKEPYMTLKRIIFGERKPLEKVPCPVQDCTGLLHLEPNADVHCIKDLTHEWKYEEWSRLAKLVIEQP